MQAAQLCQCRATAALLFNAVVQGMAMGWSSPAIIKLKDGEGPFVPTAKEQSWIVALNDLGFMCGSVICLLLYQRAGLRLTLGVTPLAFTLWAVLTYVATSPGYLYAARICTGIGISVNFAYIPIYIGEVTTPVMRSVLILATIFLVTLGQLIAYVIGPYVTYWQQALLPVPPLVLGILCYALWTHQTPYHYAMLGRYEEALCELKRLRQGLAPDLVCLEQTAIQRSVKQQMEDAATWRQTLSPPGAKRAAGIFLVIGGRLGLFGLEVVQAYTQEIFEEAGSPISKSVSSMLVIGVKMVMVFVAMYLIERVGRRLQLSVSALMNALAMVTMSAYFLAKEHLGWDVSSVKWLPLVALMVFMAATGGGFMPVSHVLIGELLGQRGKRIVNPLVMTVSAMWSFGISKSFMPLGDSVGFCVPFGIFAFTNMFVVIFTIVFVPETKGKTLAEIQEELSHRLRRTNNVRDDKDSIISRNPSTC